MSNAEKQANWRDRQKNKARRAALQAYYVGRADTGAGRDYRSVASLADAVDKLDQADDEGREHEGPEIVRDTWRPLNETPTPPAP